MIATVTDPVAVGLCVTAVGLFVVAVVVGLYCVFTAEDDPDDPDEPRPTASKVAALDSMGDDADSLVWDFRRGSGGWIA